MFAALKLCGMPPHMYELNTALAAALAAEEAETSWRQGEDIFAGLVPLPMDPELDAQVARVAERLAPTL